MSVYKIVILFYNVYSKFTEQTNYWGLFNMKRVISYIPEIQGCYGMRIWVPRNDTELLSFIKPICLWGGPTDSRSVDGTKENLYELPLGIVENTLWQMACRYVDIEFVQKYK